MCRFDELQRTEEFSGSDASKSTSSLFSVPYPTTLEICLPAIRGQPLDGKTAILSFDESHISFQVDQCIRLWGTTTPMHPVEFLRNIFRFRGYSEDFIPALSSDSRRPPTIKQLQDYDNEVVGTIRNSDVKKLEELFLQGKSMSACNRFSESIVHTACRRAEKEIIQFLVNHGGNLAIVDDYGRTPLHDACWRPEPEFDIITIIMDKNPDLIRFADMRGATPLDYVQEEHWTLWCAFLYCQLDRYWPLNHPDK